MQGGRPNLETVGHTPDPGRPDEGTRRQPPARSLPAPAALPASGSRCPGPTETIVLTWENAVIIISVRPIASAAQRLASLIAECNQAQRRAAILGMTPDQGPGASQAPETYQEFLYRTSGPLLHEPSAARRAGGRTVR